MLDSKRAIFLKLNDGTRLVDGALLSFGDDPQRYILHYGKYKIHTKGCLSSATCSGWYVQAIGTAIAIPISDDMFTEVKVINSGAEITLSSEYSAVECCRKQVFKEAKFTELDQYLLSRAWVTVDTLAELESLPEESFMTGRIVEVNDEDNGSPQYFRYSPVTQKFEPVQFIHTDIDGRISEIEKTLDDIIARLDIGTESE